MRKLLALALLVALPLVAGAQTVTMPKDVKVARGQLASIDVSYDGDGFRYVVVGDAGAGFREHVEEAKAVKLRILGYKDGLLYVVAYCAKGTKTSLPAVCVVTVGDGPQPPVPPVPPVPPKPPVPPDPPKPPDPPAPQPTAKVKVLIVEESSDRTKLPAAQQFIIVGKEMRDYLDSVCSNEVQTASGRAWLIADKDADLSGYGKFWADLLARPRGGTPWMVITNDQGAVVYSGPLPADTNSAKATISKFVTPQKRKAG